MHHNRLIILSSEGLKRQKTGTVVVLLATFSSFAMRLFAVLLLGILATSIAAAPGRAASLDITSNAAEVPSTAVGCPVGGVDQKLPADWFWSGGLLVGCISFSLKSQLRRRGFLDGPRGRTFSGLISLPRKPAAQPEAAHDSQRREDDRRGSS